MRQGDHLIHKSISRAEPEPRPLIFATDVKRPSHRASTYLRLTKPRIMLLVLVAAATALVFEGSLLYRPMKLLVFFVGIYLTGGAANALNQYFERQIDARMDRTCRRPLPLGLISPTHALIFAVAIGLIGVILLGAVFNLLTAGLALATILFYSLVYTLWLKPRTPQNIVIGGAAGAMAPVGAWAAATGSTAVMPWVLFIIIFFWTPPHSWSLALRYKDEYGRAGLPMMPVTHGPERTLSWILLTTVATVGASMLHLFAGGGWIYGISALALGSEFIRRAWLARETQDMYRIWGTFTYSIVYLFGLLGAMMADKVITVVTG